MLNTIALALAVLLRDSSDAQQIRAINRQYVSSWLKGEKDGVLNLFENEAVLTPSGLGPIKGKPAIVRFWFPDDGSKMKVLKFTNEILEVDVDGNFANSTQKSFLSWSYEKGNSHLTRDQWGYEMTTYHRQSTGGWKIWRQVWTDYRIVNR